MVGLGAYLVNATGGCNDCHTCPPYQPADDPFNHGSGHPNAQNYLAGGHQFGPFVTSANITPRNGLPAGLTEERFIHTIRTGEDPDHPGQLLQVMPWPVYRNLTDRDLRAIYAYLARSRRRLRGPARGRSSLGKRADPPPLPRRPLHPGGPPGGRPPRF